MGRVVSPTPRPPLSAAKPLYLLYMRQGGLQGYSGRAENLVLTGIRSRTNVYVIINMSQQNGVDSIRKKIVCLLVFFSTDMEYTQTRCC